LHDTGKDKIGRVRLGYLDLGSEVGILAQMIHECRKADIGLTKFWQIHFLIAQAEADVRFTIRCRVTLAAAQARPSFPLPTAALLFVSGIKIQKIPNANVATPARKRNAALKPTHCTMKPVMPLESDAPKPVAVATTPCVKLNRPVPRVRSAITSTLTTPKRSAYSVQQLYADEIIRIVAQRIKCAADWQWWPAAIPRRRVHGVESA
jgi:hypothetical protein